MDLLSPSLTKKYWLASGSRDRLTQIYEYSPSDGPSYTPVCVLDDHSSTINALRFAEERSTKGQKRLKLVSCGADKQIVWRNIDLTERETADEYTVVQKKEQVKNKIFSMDVNSGYGYAITGHDKQIQMWALSTYERLWERKPDTKKGTD